MCNQLCSYGRPTACPSYVALNNTCKVFNQALLYLPYLQALLTSAFHVDLPLAVALALAFADGHDVKPIRFILSKTSQPLRWNCNVAFTQFQLSFLIQF